MSDNPKRLKQTHLFDALPPPRDADVVATVYSWTFDPPFDHALKGCAYFGQTKQTFEMRTSQHKSNAVRNLKELGVHALWRLYPYDDHWVIQVIETRRFVNPIEAHAWMNEEEMRLIDEHGGVLRDMDKKLNQTLNLTRGGQGDPRAVWDAITARSRKRLLKVWPKFERWYEKNKHLRIPLRDPDLGTVVHHIRTRKDFLQHADFREWLDARGFVYDEHRAHLELEIWPKFKRWYEKNKHLRIPIRNPDLGKVVKCIRTRNSFLQHADFKAWLDARGFIYDERRAHLELDIWPRFERWYEKKEHLCIPISDPDLGTVVHGIRSRNCFLQYADFKAWLDERGFVYDERRAHLELDIWPKFKRWYEEKEHLRIPRSDPDLGRVIDHIRTRKDYLHHADFAMWLWCACFEMHTTDAQTNRERWTHVFASTNGT
jgi:hypothetical protein